MGMDLEALDSALNVWLGDAPPPAATARETDFQVSLVVSTGATHGEATVAVNRPLVRGPERAVDPGARLSFPVAVTSDGAVEGRGYLGNAVVVLNGSLTGGTARGALRWTGRDETAERLSTVFRVLAGGSSGVVDQAPCDTGPLPFEAGR